MDRLGLPKGFDWSPLIFCAARESGGTVTLNTPSARALLAALRASASSETAARDIEDAAYERAARILDGRPHDTFVGTTMGSPLRKKEFAIG